MHVLVIFILVTAEYHHNIAGANGVCEPLNQTLSIMSIPPMSVNSKIRIQCVDGYVRKAGTSNLYRCTEIDGKLSWINTPKLVCIPDPSIPNKTDAPTSTTQKIQTFPVTSMSTTETTFRTTNEGTTTKPRTTTNLPTESVTLTSEIPSSTWSTSTSRQYTTTSSPPTQSAPLSTTGVSTSMKTSTISNEIDPEFSPHNISASSTSMIGGAAGVILVCLVAAVGLLLWWRFKHRATNPANVIQLDHTNYATCVTYIPVPVSEHCSAEPPDIDDAANKSTTDSQTE